MVCNVIEYSIAPTNIILKTKSQVVVIMVRQTKSPLELATLLEMPRSRAMVGFIDGSNGGTRYQTYLLP